MTDVGDTTPFERQRYLGQKLEDFENELDYNLPTRRLKQLRTGISRSEILSDLQELFQETNDPSIKAEFIDFLDRIALQCSDRKSGRAWWSDISVKTGVAGGVTMTGGSIIASAGVTASLLLFVPLAAGLFAVGIGTYVGSRLNSEQKVYGDIESRINQIKAELVK